MQLAEYETMFHHEEDYWWYVGLRDLVLAEIARFSEARGPLTILDAGCGTGKLLAMCSGHHAYGVELSQEAFRFLRHRSLNGLVRASVCRIPFPDETFDIVLSLDVLYSVEPPGDVQGLCEMVRVLKRGGLLVINLPAYEFLRSRHDAVIHTKTRYTRSRLRTLLEEVGLRQARITYRNTFLFPAAALMRCSQKLTRMTRAEPKSDLRPLPGFLNRALARLLFVENRLIRQGMSMPFGLSLFCIVFKGQPGAVYRLNGSSED
jgi:SAM-dependent methyltransferase